jgi:tRNA (guanine-N7-)-methyltransferase
MTLEIGFGMGGSLAAMAAAEPERRFLGVEVHTPGVGALMAALEDQGLTNVRVLEGDVVQALDRLFQPRSLDRVQIFFPDPWPKKRHHKRRLIQPPFLEQLASLVRPGGHLWLATDWVPYAEAMGEALAQVPVWKALPAAPARPETRFERRGLRKGHVVVDLFLERLP